MLRSAFTAVLALTLVAGAQAESYVVSPQASEQTKAAVAEGKAPDHGFPEIRDVHFSSQTRLHPGANLAATVETSDNVSYVEGRVKFWNIPFTQTATGRFKLNYRVPLLPPNAFGHWDLEVIARSVDGVEARRVFSVSYSYF